MLSTYINFSVYVNYSAFCVNKVVTSVLVNFLVNYAVS